LEDALRALRSSGSEGGEPEVLIQEAHLVWIRTGGREASDASGSEGEMP
jgi:hypothetical protein